MYVVFLFILVTVYSEHVIVKTADQARDQLEFLQSKLDCCLVIDGESLQVRSLLVHSAASLML